MVGSTLGLREQAVKTFRGLRIESVLSAGNRWALVVTVHGRGEQRSAEVTISPNTAVLLREICSSRPFKPRAGDCYSYWIEGVGHIEQNVGSKFHKWNPRMYLLVRRGKSRLKRRIPCTIYEYEALLPIARETLDDDLLQQILRWEAGSARCRSSCSRAG